MNHLDEGKFGRTVVIGLALVGIGLVGFLCTIVGGLLSGSYVFSGFYILLGVFALMFLAGIGLSGSMLFKGFQIGSGATRKSSPVRVARGAKVISRFALDRDQNMHFPTEVDEDFDLRYFAQFLLPDGTKLELECNPLSYAHLGEGLTGTVTYKGDWLGVFDQDSGDKQELYSRR